jgi:hypothetical protein
MLQLIETLFAFFIALFILWCLWKSCEQEIEIESDDESFECC